MYLQTHEYKHEHVCACTKWLLILLVFLLIMKPTNKNCGALLKKESMYNYSFCTWQGLKKGGVKISVICKPWLVCWVEIQRKKYFKSYFDHSICRKNQLPSLCIFFLRICFSLPVSIWRCSSSVASFKAFPDCLCKWTDQSPWSHHPWAVYTYQHDFPCTTLHPHRRNMCLISLWFHMPPSNDPGKSWSLIF